MARGINKVILVGTLGKDPETRYSQSGVAMTSISVATNESWKDKNGEKQERTEWHRVKFFGRLAEIAEEYLKKGGQVYIEGSLRTEKYTDKQGVEKYSTDIIANEMQMLGGRPEGSGDREERQPARGRDTGRQAPERGRGEERGGRDERPASRDRDDRGGERGHSRHDEPFPDDDIPF